MAYSCSSPSFSVSSAENRTMFAQFSDSNTSIAISHRFYRDDEDDEEDEDAVDVWLYTGEVRRSRSRSRSGSDRKGVVERERRPKEEGDNDEDDEARGYNYEDAPSYHSEPTPPRQSDRNDINERESQVSRDGQTLGDMVRAAAGIPLVRANGARKVAAEVREAQRRWRLNLDSSSDGCCNSRASCGSERNPVREECNCILGDNGVSEREEQEAHETHETPDRQLLVNMVRAAAGSPLVGVVVPGYTPSEDELYVPGQPLFDERDDDYFDLYRYTSRYPGEPVLRHVEYGTDDEEDMEVELYGFSSDEDDVVMELYDYSSDEDEDEDEDFDGEGCIGFHYDEEDYNAPSSSPFGGQLQRQDNLRSRTMTPEAMLPRYNYFSAVRIEEHHTPSFCRPLIANLLCS